MMALILIANALALGAPGVALLIAGWRDARDYQADRMAMGVTALGLALALLAAANLAMALGGAA